jgi:hypothetical protein
MTRLESNGSGRNAIGSRQPLALKHKQQRRKAA